MAQVYRDFADHEAHGASEVYEAWSRAVAADEHTCLLIESLPHGKRQPNLIFAAARWHGCPATVEADLPGFLGRHWSDLLPTIMSRRTQTNEPGRCATLLPVLARLPGPLALIEVGASAGLCLLPDLYSYRYTLADGSQVALDPATGESPVVLPCRLSGIDPPRALPQVVWRKGLDLNPIRAADPDAAAWLETLVWPGQPERRERLVAALGLAAPLELDVVAGDLTEQLEDVVAQAPSGATVVVFHSAVLAYVDAAGRATFRRLVERLPVRWLSNESPMVFPELGVPTGVDRPAESGQFVLALGGEPVGWAQAHGRSLVG